MRTEGRGPAWAHLPAAAAVCSIGPTSYRPARSGTRGARHGGSLSGRRRLPTGGGAWRLRSLRYGAQARVAVGRSGHGIWKTQDSRLKTQDLLPFGLARTGRLSPARARAKVERKVM